MTEYTKLIERLGERYGVPDLSTDQLLNRRDRKRRNQRIAAGLVGIAVFVVAVWIVTSGLSFNRTQMPAVPGGVETSPPGIPVDGWNGHGLPPEGTPLSTPVEGTLIAKHRFLDTFVSVYADGRVLWWASDGSLVAPGGTILERRLTLHGLDLVRSGAITLADLTPPQVLHGVLPSAWADDEARPYAPPRYSVCFSPPSAVMSLLPSPAEALLRGSDTDRSHPRCLQVTTEKARALNEILSEAGLIPGESRGVTAAEWLLRDDGGHFIAISLNPLFPDGGWNPQ